MKLWDIHNPPLSWLTEEEPQLDADDTFDVDTKGIEELLPKLVEQQGSLRLVDIEQIRDDHDAPGDLVDGGRSGQIVGGALNQQVTDDGHQPSSRDADGRAEQPPRATIKQTEDPAESSRMEVEFDQPTNDDQAPIAGDPLSAVQLADRPRRTVSRAKRFMDFLLGRVRQ